MATSITYGSYSFPEPLPLFSEEDEPVKLAGLYDHSAIRVNIVGYLTGADLSGLDLQKMQMISGFLNEYEDLTVTVENESKVCSGAYVESISFQDSDLTTFLPYSLTALYYSGETFSDYFKVADPSNSWSYSEGENKIITATHSVSARGLKVDSVDPLVNARHFVTGKLENGFEALSLFNTGSSNAFLTSRSESIDKKSSTYSVEEVYQYSASDDPISDSGVVSVSTSITHNVQGGLSVSVQGSVLGAMNASTGDGLLSTGNFTPNQATEIAMNAVVNSYSDYESGIYDFIADGPTTFNYDLDTGSNTLGFSFAFEDIENLELINGNVLHTYTTSVSFNKDSPAASISIQGNLKYHGVEPISSTGDFVNNSRFTAVESAFDEIDTYSLAKSDFIDCVDIATGYKINSYYLKDTPNQYSISKNPVENTLSYNYTYNNVTDFSSGTLDNMTMTIEDTVPISLTSVQEMLVGYGAQTVVTRTLGQYAVSASSQNSAEDLEVLSGLVDTYCSGQYKISEAFSTGANNISYNLSRYY